MSYGSWPPYVSAATRKAQADRTLTGLRAAGQNAAPVRIEGRAIAKTFWGKKWCDNLESYRDFENRLPRGRTYVRNGSVLDLQIMPSLVTAMVMGSSLYRVSVRIERLPAQRWASLCRDCAGGIDSLVKLLQGRFSTGVMERLCRQDAGLFPKPSEITLSCTCPDYSEMCKHVAAALYGVGARLDAQPELLFRLRSVDEKEMVGHLDGGLCFAKPSAVLDSDDLSALFGLDIAGAAAPSAPAPARDVTPTPAPPARHARAATAVLRGADKPATPTVASAAARPRTSPIATPRAVPAVAATPEAKRSTGLKRPPGSKDASKTEGPVRYLTVEQALRRSGKTPTPAKAGGGKPPQTRPVAAPKGPAPDTLPARPSTVDVARGAQGRPHRTAINLKSLRYLNGDRRCTP